MLRAVGLFIAWLTALVYDNPDPNQSFCNCTCSIEHKTVGDHSSWQWELIKGSVFCVIGSILTISWRIIVQLGIQFVTLISYWFWAHPSLPNNSLPSPSLETEAVGDKDPRPEIATRAQEQLATLRHRQALRQTNGSR